MTDEKSPYVFTIKTLSGKLYNVQRASAVDQKTLLLLVGERFACLSVSPVVADDAMLDAKLIAGALIALSEDTFDKVASLCLKKVVENGGNKIITVDDFQNDIMSYVDLIAQSLKENLKDFFSLLQKEKLELANKE